MLLLGQFVKHFVGFGSTESATLFALLQARITKLENTIDASAYSEVVSPVRLAS